MSSKFNGDISQSHKLSYRIYSFLIGAIPLGLYWSGLQFYLFNSGFLRVISSDLNASRSICMYIGGISGSLIAILIYYILKHNNIWHIKKDINSLLACICIILGTIFELICNKELYPFTFIPFIGIGPLFIMMGLFLLLITYIHLASHHQLIWTIAQAFFVCILSQIVFILLDNVPTFISFIIYGILITIGGIWVYFLPIQRNIKIVDSYKNDDVISLDTESFPLPISLKTSHTNLLEFTRENRSILFSAVMVCIFLAFFTMGNTWQSLLQDGGLYSIVPISLLCCVIALIAICWWGHAKADHTVAFVIFKAALPVAICIALIMKIIPLDFTSILLYRDIMRVVFILAQPLAFSFIVYVFRYSENIDIRILVYIIIICSVAELIGLITSLANSDRRMMWLGILTAIALLYEVILFGREIVEFNKPVDIDPIHFSSGDDLDARCFEIGKQYGLTSREQEVLRELARGHSSGYIASAFCISTNTARSHMKNIYRKFGISSREELLDFLLNNAK